MQENPANSIIIIMGLSAICQNLRIISQYDASFLHVVDEDGIKVIKVNRFIRNFLSHEKELKKVLIDNIEFLNLADRSVFVDKHEYTEIFLAAQKFNKIVAIDGFWTNLPKVTNSSVGALEPIICDMVKKEALTGIAEGEKPFWQRELFRMRMYYDQHAATIDHGREALNIFFSTQKERFLSLLGRIIHIFDAYHYFRNEKEPIYRSDSPLCDSENSSFFWIGHATCLISVPCLTSSGKRASVNIITDPVEEDLNALFYPRMTKPARTMDKNPRIDLMLLSHNHADHFSPSTIKKMLPEQPAMIVPEGDGDKIRKMGFKYVYETNWWQKNSILFRRGEETLNLSITAVPSNHWSAWSGFDRNCSAFLGYVIHGNGGDIYFAGDTARLKKEHIKTLKERFNIRVMFQPGGPDEMRKDMKTTHQASVDALWMHFNLFVEKIYDEAKDENLTKQVFMKMVEGHQTFLVHTKTYKLGNLHFDDTDQSIDRVLNALVGRKSDLKDYEENVLHELLSLAKKMRFKDGGLSKKELHYILSSGIYVPYIGERSLLVC